MMEYMILAVALLGLVVALSAISNRLGVAPALILMTVGVGVSFLPFVSAMEIDPDWILMVILPPLLYSAAIATPTADLRRDFTAVGGLAIVLVVVCAVAIGFVITWLIPGVPLPVGIALGAILSPTDAAATTSIKRLGVPGRIGTILQGEALFNDATSLVLLRSAIAATAATVSLWSVVGNFLWAALAASVIGIVVGWLGVRLRRLVHSPAASTAISLLLPFVAYVPAELVHASGLVASVAAGITAAQIGPARLDARQRIAERENWHTVEFLLEGAVFLMMGLELYALVSDLWATGGSIWQAVLVAGVALVIIVALRWLFLVFLVGRTTASTHRRVRRWHRWQGAGLVSGDGPTHFDGTDVAAPEPDEAEERRQERLRRRSQQVRDRLADTALQGRAHGLWRRFKSGFTVYVADVGYLLHQPLGIKEATLLTWAGMRGVVTLAAAQTLPLATPHRSLLILIAFVVAAGSLILQGGTLSAMVKALGLAGQGGAPEGEWDRLNSELDLVTGDWEPEEPLDEADLPLARLQARRLALLDLRSAGAYTSRTLSVGLAELDAEEMRILLRQAVED